MTIRIDQDGNELEFLPQGKERVERKNRLHEAELLNKNILDQINDLESQITPRRIRESTVSDAGKMWLSDIDKKISLLRSRLLKG